MFRLPLIAVILFTLITTHAIAQTNDIEITSSIALTAIERYQKDPLAPDAGTLLSVIAKFAKQSEDVSILIDLKYFPTEFKSLESKNASQLLGAYIAGNVEYQVRNGIKENRPVEGILSMLSTYSSLKNSGAIETLPSFKDWLTKAENGELQF